MTLKVAYTSLDIASLEMLRCTPKHVLRVSVWF